jgi:hypothetical protein
MTIAGQNAQAATNDRIVRLREEVKPQLADSRSESSRSPET